MNEAGSMMRIPLRTKDFVEKDDFNRIYHRLSEYQAAVGGNQMMPPTIVLTGRSGVGKSETALQLFKRFKKDNKGFTYLERSFNTDSVNALINDLTNFNHEKDLQMRTLAQEQRSQILGQIFEELFDVLNTKFPNHIKCLTFDDAEQATYIVKHINDNICEKIQGNIHEKWKIIITTQNDCKEKWLEGCDSLNEQNFFSVLAFDLDHTKSYLENVRGITDELKKLLHETLGGLPLALRVTRRYLTENQLYSQDEYVGRFLKDLEAINASDQVLGSLHISMARLIDSLEHPDLAKLLLKLISVMDDKNMTPTVLVALAETVITHFNGQVNPRMQAHVLSNRLVEGLVNRHLCEVVEVQGIGRLVSLHQLVKEGALMFKQDDTPDEKRLLARLSLMALTRVTPKDGRTRQSHIIYGYMCRHGNSVKNFIEGLRNEEVVTRLNAPATLLLYSNLLTCMSYCLLAQRTPVQEATPYLEEALDVYSIVFTEDKYNQLRVQNLANPSDMDKHRAERLWDEGLALTSPLFNNEEYSAIVEMLSPHHQLTKKDLKNMMVDKVHKVEHFLQNGHINQYYLNELRRREMIVEPTVQERIYFMEILIEIYYVWLRVPVFAQEGAFNERAQQCGRAAVWLCENVREHHKIPLMTEVLIARDVLLLDIKLGNREVPLILEEYKELMRIGRNDRRRYGYEYGLRRTDFADDDYHKLLCKEGKAMCYGKLCSITLDISPQDADQHYIHGEAIFQELVAETIQRDNFQTISKTCKMYAAFLLDCNKTAEAVRTLIDAMINLNKYLQDEASDGSDYPEQNNSGKFTSYYKKLKEYYERWSRDNPNRSTMLLSDGNDANRITYIQGFTDHYYKHHHPQGQPDSDNKYHILEDLIPGEAVDEQEETQGYVQLAQPQEADAEEPTQG